MECFLEEGKRNSTGSHSGGNQMLFLNSFIPNSLGFPGSSDSKESACNAEDLGSSLGWEDALEKEMAIHSNILAWRIPMDRGAWRAMRRT